jgi:hypothetical protein
MPVGASVNQKLTPESSYTNKPHRDRAASSDRPVMFFQPHVPLLTIFSIAVFDIDRRRVIESTRAP